MKQFFLLLTVGYLLLNVSLMAQSEVAQVGNMELHLHKPYHSIFEKEVASISKVSELHRQYKHDWFEKYLEVKLSAMVDGKKQYAIGKSELLNEAQKSLLSRADKGTTLHVEIKYIPNNQLSYNPARVYDFKFEILPDINASFPKGVEGLYAYLKDNVDKELLASDLKGYDLISLIICIDEEGKVKAINDFAPEFSTASNSVLKNKIIQTLNNMPCWNPAQYKDGTPTQQEWVLLIGNRENCISALINK